jgi:hypothetical protein
MKWALVLLCAAALLAGCGSSKNAASTSATPPKVLPDATTADEWARRVVDLVLRPLNNDLQVVNGFRNAQIRFYITTENQTTLSTIHKRIGDLQRCPTKLDVIGPPPPGYAQLGKVNRLLRRACASYEDVATKLLEATDLMSSGNTDGVKQGEKVLNNLGPATHAASNQLIDAVKVAQDVGAFRRAGLRPSV